MRQMEVKMLKVRGHRQSRKWKEVLGIAGWISAQETTKGVSFEICLEWWDETFDLNVD